MKNYSRNRNSGAPAWLLQRITGIFLFFVVIGHYLLMHYTPESGHTYQAVIERLRNPLYKALDLSFVTIGMYHGVQGVWNVIRDFKLAPWLSLTLYGILVIAAVTFVVMGWNTIISL